MLILCNYGSITRVHLLLCAHEKPSDIFFAKRSQHREEKSSRSGSRTDRARSTRSDEARAGSERSSNRSGGRNESARGRGSLGRDVRGARTEHRVRGEGRGCEYARAARSYSEGGNCADRNSGDSSSRRSDGTREREVHVGAGNRSFSPRKG